MKFLKYMAGISVSLALVACGGGGGSPGGGTTTVGETPVTIDVLNTSGSSSLLSAGAEATITAYVKNAANAGVTGQAVTFSSTSGILSKATAQTGEGGVVTVTLSAGGDKTIRDITVTATSGKAIGTIIVPVTGTSLSIAGSGSLQAGGSAATYTVRAVDSSNKPISLAKIAVASSLGNAISPGELTTDPTGSATFQYTPATPGVDTLKVSGLGTNATSSVAVTAVDFSAVAPASNATITVGASQVVTVRYRVAGSGVAGKSVAFSTTRGTFAAPATITTDSNGDASATLSSTTAGPGVIVAQIAGVGQVNIPVQFVAVSATTIIVQSNPGAILPNTSGNSSQSTIDVSVRDAAGNAVANQQVNFSILEDVSNGTLSPGSATTDVNGRAQVQFISGASPTPANGVVIQAEVAGTAIRGTTKLTVNGKSLFITIGYGNSISNLNETTYSKEFTVYLTDANGVAVGNQAVTLSAVPQYYRKGYLSWDSKQWSYSSKLRGDAYDSPTASCPNEDVNFDGVLDIGEDSNGNGMLTPGNVAITAPGSVTTDAAGRATFNLQYGEQFAGWVQVRMIARTSVAGTESRQSMDYWLAGVSSDYTNETVPPAGATSPFGVGASGLCTDPL